MAAQYFVNLEVQILWTLIITTTTSLWNPVRLDLWTFCFYTSRPLDTLLGVSYRAIFWDGVCGPVCASQAAALYTVR